MYKAYLFDVDGVLIKQEKYFSEIFAEIFNIPLYQVLEFFDGEFKECLVGKKDMRDILPEYIKKWGLDISVEGFLKLWFETENDLDEELLSEVAKLKKQGAQLYVATKQEINRTAYLRDEMGLGKIFEKIYSSGEIGFVKPDPGFYKFILRDLAPLQASEILYFDDSQKNVDAAKSLGIKSVLYRGIKDFYDAVKQ